MVLFHEFGDNALVFRAYFWLRVQRPIAKIRIESDVRYRIEHLLREAGIAIAFPQRDVHLDTSSPLDVRVLAAADRAASE
jgi:small-conductance mechanosensitive channel